MNFNSLLGLINGSIDNSLYSYYGSSSLSPFNGFLSPTCPQITPNPYAGSVSYKHQNLSQTTLVNGELQKSHNMNNSFVNWGEVNNNTVSTVQQEEFPFEIVIPKKERTDTKCVGQISRSSFVYHFTQKPSSKPRPSSPPFFYVVNIPFLATSIEKDVEKINYLVELFQKQAFKGHTNPVQELQSRLVLVIGINKPRSLLEDQKRKFQKLLRNIEKVRGQWKCNVNIFCFNWEPQWSQKENELNTDNPNPVEGMQKELKPKKLNPKYVSFEKVHDFFKSKDPQTREKLKEIIRQEERKINRACVPFGRIRDAIKNSQATMESVRHFQLNDLQNKSIYLCTMDADVLNLQVTDWGLFKAYDEFLSKQPSSPELLSGGVHISSMQDVFFHLQWDLANRIKECIVSSFDSETYFTETNTLIKIPENFPCVPESFGHGANEMLHFIQELREKRSIQDTAENNKICFVSKAALTTTAPSRMQREYDAYVFDGKVHYWDEKDLRTMRSVIKQIFEPLDWARALRSRLSSLQNNQHSIYQSKPDLDKIHKQLSAIFKVFDPISYALNNIKGRKNSFHTLLQQACIEPSLTYAERSEEITDSLKILASYYSDEILKKIYEVACNRGKVIAKFILEYFDFAAPTKDILKESGFTTLGQWIKRLSKEQVDSFHLYSKLSKKEWESHQKALLNKINGYKLKGQKELTKQEEILSRLHIALLHEASDPTIIDRLIKQDLDKINDNYHEKSIYPHPFSLAWERQNEEIIRCLLKATLPLKVAQSEVKKALFRITSRIEQSSASTSNLDKQKEVIEYTLRILDGTSSPFDRLDLLFQEIELCKGMTPFHWFIFFKRESISKVNEQTLIPTISKCLPLNLFPQKTNSKNFYLFISELAKDIEDYDFIVWLFYQAKFVQLEQIPPNPGFLRRILKSGSTEEIHSYIASYPISVKGNLPKKRSHPETTANSSYNPSYSPVISSYNSPWFTTEMNYGWDKS